MAQVMVFNQKKQPTQDEVFEMMAGGNSRLRLMQASFKTENVASLSTQQYRDVPGHFGCEVWIRGKAEPYFFSAISVLGMQILFERAEESEKVALFRKKHPLLSWVREWFYKMFVAAIGPAEHA